MAVVGDDVYTIDSTHSAVSVFDARTGRPVRYLSLPTGIDYDFVSVAVIGRDLYLANSRNGAIVEISARNGTLVRS